MCVCVEGGGGGSGGWNKGITYIVVVAVQCVLPWLRLTRLPETRETWKNVIYESRNKRNVKEMTFVKAEKREH